MKFRASRKAVPVRLRARGRVALMPFFTVFAWFATEPSARAEPLWWLLPALITASAAAFAVRTWTWRLHWDGTFLHLRNRSLPWRDLVNIVPVRIWSASFRADVGRTAWHLVFRDAAGRTSTLVLQPHRTDAPGRVEALLREKRTDVGDPAGLRESAGRAGAFRNRDR